MALQKNIRLHDSRLQELEVAMFQTNKSKSKFDYVYEKIAEIVSSVLLTVISKRKERKKN